MMNLEQIEQLLAQAASVAAAQGVPLEAFMNAACRAYVEKHPNMLEQIEAMQLCNHLALLRMQGRVASA